MLQAVGSGVKSVAPLPHKDLHLWFYTPAGSSLVSFTPPCSPWSFLLSSSRSERISEAWFSPLRWIPETHPVAPPTDAQKTHLSPSAPSGGDAHPTSGRRPPSRWPRAERRSAGTAGPKSPRWHGRTGTPAVPAGRCRTLRSGLADQAVSELGGWLLTSCGAVCGVSWVQAKHNHSPSLCHWHSLLSSLWERGCAWLWSTGTSFCHW